MASCIECDAPLDLSRKNHGEKIDCFNCGSTWQVVGTGKSKDIDFPQIIESEDGDLVELAPMAYSDDVDDAFSEEL